MVSVDVLSPVNVTLADQLPVANEPLPGADVTQPLLLGVAGIAVTVAIVPPCDKISLKAFVPVGVVVLLVSVPPVADDIVQAVEIVPLATELP